MNTLQKSIMWDRYALKEKDRAPELNDWCIVTFEGKRLPGRIASAAYETLPAQYDVKLDDGDTVCLSETDIDIVIEDEYDIWLRMARNAANNEREFNAFKGILYDWKFVPAGRILANLGSGTNESYYNCFVLPSPQDSRGGILATLGQMVEIMSRGGGVGINLSSLRPKNARVRGVDGKSSGAVSWGKIYSDTTGLIIQGGSRRGALMLMLDVEHPDLLEFIKAKQTPGQYTNCNMSVVISDAFMDAVRQNQYWDFSFPDTTDPEYINWTGDRTGYTGAMIRYPGLKAKEIWQTIMESAWKSGEPGVWFRDRANSNSFSTKRLVATNPCGEQGLPPWGVCNLGALNLGKFVGEDGKVADQDLKHAVKDAVRFLDNIIDKNVYTFEENREQQLRERRVGLNFMGLADMLVKLKIRYGSKLAVSFCNTLFMDIKCWAYEASIELAKEKGPYPDFDIDNYKGEFWDNLPEYLRQDIRKYGIRNVTLLTAAPTGTTGTMVGASTGIEPYFALSWTRNSRLGSFEERVSTVEGFDLSNLPRYFVTAQELEPIEHVAMQAAIQRHVDASISKTINLPAETTIEGVANVYQMLYDNGCKGGTVYRDQSRNEQVLVITTNKPPTEVQISIGKQTNLECPECKELSLVKEAGCSTCSNCGYSLCSL